MTDDAQLLALLREATNALRSGLGVEWLLDENDHLLGFQVTFLTKAATERALGDHSVRV